MLRWVSVLMVLVVLVAVVVGAGPFALVLAAVWSLLAFCLSYTREARRRAAIVEPGLLASFRYHLCALGVSYLVPIAAATAFYVLLSIYIAVFRDSVSIDWLISMQRAFEDVSQFFTDNLKLSTTEVLAVLVGVYVLSCVLLVRRREGGGEPAIRGSGLRTRLVASLHRTADSYGKYSVPVATGVATLASLTLFGMQLGEPAKNLELRVKVAQEGYAEIARRTESEISQRVTTALYGKLRNAFPPSYRAALKLPTRINTSAADVRQHAEDAKSEYGVSVAVVDRLLRTETTRMTTFDELGSELRVEATGRSSMPGGTTYEQVETARNALRPDSHPSRKGIELLAVGQKKVILQVEKLASERILTLTRPLTEAFPILEPLVTTLADAADNTVRERLGKSYDRAMEAALRDPPTRQAVVEREAGAVVAETDVDRLVDRAAPRAGQQARRLRRTLSSLTKGDALIGTRVDKAEAARWSWARTHGGLLPLPDLDLPPLPRPIPPLYPPPSVARPGGDPYPPDVGGRGGAERFTPPRPVAPPRPPPRVPIIIP